MPCRNFSAGNSYRYGFNGKELDKDISNLTDYDYGFRIYNPALGRFLSVDPLSGKYPFYTPYSFAGNKPVQCIDLDGSEETIPYLQSAAFDQIATSLPGVSYVRGKSGDKLATHLPQEEKGWFDQFFESISPIRLMPVEPAPYVAQAVNFGNSVGAVVYDLESSERGEYKAVTDGGAALSNNKKTVYLQISGYSEVGKAVVQNLRNTCGLSELSNAEIAEYVESVKFIFEPGKDYSALFWKKSGLLQDRQVLLAQIGPIAIPIAPASPILMPPLGAGTSALNTPAGSITISTEAISQEIAATLAPGILQMSKKKGNQLLDDLPNTLEGLNELKAKIKERTTANNGQVTDPDKKLQQKIKTQEKAIGQRNKQKRGNK